MEDDVNQDPNHPTPSAEARQQASQQDSQLDTQSGGGLVRKLLRWTAGLFLGLSLLLAVLYVTRERTLHPLIVKLAPPIAKSMVGFQLELDDIDGDWYTGLAFEGLSIDASNGSDLGPLVAFSSQHISLQGNVASTILGGDWAELSLIQIDSPSLVLDESLVQPEVDPDNPEPLAIPVLPYVELENGNIEIRLENDTIRLADVDLHGSGSVASPFELRTQAGGQEWRAEVRASLVRENAETLRFSAEVPAGTARAVELSLRGLKGSWSASETRIEQGTLSAGSNEITAANVVLRQGPLGPEAGGQLSFDLKDLQDAHHVACAFQGLDDREGWSGSVHGTVDLEPLPGQVAKGKIKCTGADLVTPYAVLGTVHALATADERGIVLEELLASDGSGSQARASGAILADWRTLEDVRIALQLERPASVHGALEGVTGLRATIELDGDMAAPTGHFELRADSVDAEGVHLENVTANGILADGSVDLSGIHANSEYGEVTAAVQATWAADDQPLAVVIQALTWEQKGARLELTQPVPIHLADGSIKIQDLRLRSGEGHANLNLETTPNRDLLLDLDVADLEVEPFLTAFAALEDLRLGTLNGTATVRVDGAGPQGATGSVDLSLARAPGAGTDGIAARILADWRDETIQFKDVVIELRAAQLQLAGSAPLCATGCPLGPGAVDLQGRIVLDARALTQQPLRSLLPQDAGDTLSRAAGRAFAQLDLKGQWSALRGTLNVDLEQANIEPLPGREPLLPEPISGTLALVLGETIELQPSGLRLGRTAEATIQGSLSQSLDATALLIDPTARLDSWINAPLQVDADLEFQSLGWLARFLPELRETSGILTGKCSLSGTAQDPEPSGTLVLRDGGARYRGFPPLEKAQVEISIAPEQIRIHRAEMEIGAAPVAIQGTILHDQGEPRINATLTGTDVLLARSTDARIRADIDLTIRGRTDDLTVSGDIRLVDGRIRSPIEFQSLLSGSAAAPEAIHRGIRIPSFGPDTVKLDLNVTSKEALSLRGRIARGSIRADLRISGTAEHPTPTGQVFFDPLELAVPAGTIRFPTGLIRFDPQDSEIPKIDLVGTTRLAGYDVTVNVEGDYDAPDIDLSSSPPLSPEDLLLLVLSGQPPTRGGGIEAAGQSVAFYVAKDLVRGWFSSGGFEDDDRESFLDRLEVTTGRDVSRSGTLTLEATYKLREGLARKRDAIYVVLERDSYEDYGLGLRFVLRLR